MLLLGRARTLLFPSIWYEGLPMTILEALSFGIPVVGYRIGAMPEIVTQGREGFLVSPGDTIEFIRRAAQLIRDDELRERMSRAGLASFASRFAPAKTYDRLMEIYNKAIEVAHAGQASS